MNAHPPSAKDAAPPWRVLVVDDSRDDAELAELALRDAGMDVVLQRVASADGLRRALDAFAPHIVVSDVNIPGFSGAEALAMVRAHDPGRPLVFVTGSLMFSDERPPPADGLLLKEELSQLPALLQRLLAAGRPVSP